MNYLDGFNPGKIDSIPEVRQALIMLKMAINNGEIGGSGETYQLKVATASPDAKPSDIETVHTILEGKLPADTWKSFWEKAGIKVTFIPTSDTTGSVYLRCPISQNAEEILNISAPVTLEMDDEPTLVVGTVDVETNDTGLAESDLIPKFRAALEYFDANNLVLEKFCRVAFSSDSGSSGGGIKKTI